MSAYIDVPKVKLALYRPGETLKFLGVWGNGISRFSAYEGGIVAALHTDRLYLFLPGDISGKGHVESRAIVRPDGLTL